MRRGIHLAILVCGIIGTVPPMSGQAFPGAGTMPAPLEVTLAYNAVRSNGSTGACACFWMIGELAAQHVNGINSANQDLGLVTYLFGPRFSYRKYRGFTLFGQALIGGVHGFDAYFPNPNGSAVTPDAFAMAAGGGLNLGVSRHLAIRPVQMDYLRTQLPNDAGNRENSLRLGAGIVIMIDPPK